MVTPDIQGALASGKETIGYLIWYDCRNARITPVDLRALFTKHGLDDKHFPQTR